MTQLLIVMECLPYLLSGDCKLEFQQLGLPLGMVMDQAEAPNTFSEVEQIHFAISRNTSPGMVMDQVRAAGSQIFCWQPPITNCRVSVIKLIMMIDQC